jgi:hypothetical protein
MSNKKIVISVLALIIVVLAAIFFVTNYFPAYQKPEPSPTPTPYVYPYLKPTPSYSIGLSQWEVNVTQGETLHIVVTITSFLDKVIKFTPEVQLAGYGNAAWDPSKDSHKVYNATFSQEQLVLKPFGNATTILTVNIAQDAPLGRYLFYVFDDGLEVMVVSKTNT